ncbi:hypothetical protein F4556_005210 [Kitasatospora gansuensis]|uniref:Uncharacterized protein n=1 Tax=Kitasatospora gansuensis TaxID=258050 RepID=A0A7W7SFU1_9ACTN|nr:hypothetical protein [Kitasatospora gansuensis]MBB4949675.1 hypothetical protein [Kitasatospora gansuensis]
MSWLLFFAVVILLALAAAWSEDRITERRREAERTAPARFPRQKGSK